MEPKLKARLKYIFSILYIFLPLILIVSPRNNFPNQFRNFFVAEFDRFDKERDPHSSFQDSNDESLPADPLRLMNVLRRANAMNDATSPADALDEAIKAFENQAEEPSITPVN